MSPEAVGAEHGARADEAFAALKALNGSRFRQETGKGHYEIDYQLIARDSTLLESWRHSSGARELTVFFRDGNELKATHYCGAGIQSTMRLTPSASDDVYAFAILSATNLPSPATAHNSGFAYRFTPDGNLERRETWTEDGKVSEDWATLKRLP